MVGSMPNQLEDPKVDKEVSFKIANLADYSDPQKWSFISKLFIDKPLTHTNFTNVISWIWRRSQRFWCEIVANKVIASISISRYMLT